MKGSFNALVLAAAAVSTTHAAPSQHHRRGEEPKLPFDQATTPWCSLWYDNYGEVPCDLVTSSWATTLEDFIRWNPSITSNCGNFQKGRSYCVEAYDEPPPGSAVTTTRSWAESTTAPATPTTTKPPNDMTTPQPIQTGMVDNCDVFYFVKKSEGCTDIAKAHGITFEQFLQWNPAVGKSSVIPTPSPTKISNGIATPAPIQPGMVDSCDFFYFVKKGEFCVDIASKNGITLSQFNEWNPQVGGNCAGLWAEVNVCVSVIGHNPPAPSPTKPSNGVATPTPYQDGMATNCKSFHFVGTGQGCWDIANQYQIDQNDFIRWNPAAGQSCGGLWANTYTCVGLI